MAWIPFAMTLPIPVLAALLVKRFYSDPEEAFELLSLSHGDVRNAMTLLMAGFIAQTGLLLNSAFTGSGPELIAGSIVGTFTTVTMTLSLLILNIVSRSRNSRYYGLLPSQLKNKYKE